MGISVFVRTGLAALAAVVALATSSVAFGQAFPSKPIRFIVPYPAGGTTDLMARALQKKVMTKPCHNRKEIFINKFFLCCASARELILHITSKLPYAEGYCAGWR